MTFLPIPDLLALKRILCIQPHPDDADLGCGGTVARLAQGGAKITYLTMTDGGAGSGGTGLSRADLVAQRRLEQSYALKTLGISADLLWWDLPDGYLVATLALRDRLITLIRELQPEAVLTVDPWLAYESHSDHLATGQAVAQAVFMSGMGGIAHGIPHHVTALGFFFSAHPNTYIDVSAVWEQKMQAIPCHQSQFSPLEWPQYRAFFEHQAQQWGQAQGFAQAEALKVLTPLHLHCYPEAIRA